MICDEGWPAFWVWLFASVLIYQRSEDSAKEVLGKLSLNVNLELR